MNILKNIDFTDFYFNGHYLSEFGGIVGGTERLKEYPLLPNRVYITDHAAHQDGEYVFGSYLEPRTFEVPVFFEELDKAGLRSIASWLSTKEDAWFWYKDDNLKIKCSLDGESLLESVAGYDGQVFLKFISHDPYFYQIEESQIIKQNLTSILNEFVLENIGNQECFPTIEIVGTGEIKVSVLNTLKTITYTTCTISDVVSKITLNSKTCECTLGSGANWFDSFDGEFPVLPVGDYVLKIEGSIQTVKMNSNYRWI